MNTPIRKRTPISKSDIQSMVAKFDKNQEELEKWIARNETIIHDKIPASAKESTAKGKKQSKLTRLLRFLTSFRNALYL